MQGRPSTYSEEVADKICNRIAEGEPLRQICRDEGMPPWRTVYTWLENHPDFSARFAHARRIGFDAIAEDAMSIADTPFEGEETEESDDGKRKVKRGDMLGHRRLQVETRLKLLAKWDPKRYGEKVEQTLQGPDGGPIKTQTTLTPDEAYKRMLDGE